MYEIVLIQGRLSIFIVIVMSKFLIKLELCIYIFSANIINVFVVINLFATEYFLTAG